MARTNGQLLQDRFDIAMMVGEEPYQANRSAIRKLDIQNDLGDGVQDLRTLLRGIHSFISSIEDFENVAEDVARRSLSSVR